MDDTTFFKGTVLNPRLIFRNQFKGIKHVNGYIRLTTNNEDPAYMFNVIYHQALEGHPVGIINIVIYNKVYGKDVSTINVIDDEKLYSLANHEKSAILYSKNWSTKEDTFVEDGNKVTFARPYAEAVEQWLTQIFSK